MRRAGWLAPALALMLVFSGCSQSGSDLSAAAAPELQSLVVSVAETAATGDFSAAVAELDALQAALDTARAQGDVTEERASSIQAAIDVVRADLLQAVESETPGVPTEEPVEAPVVSETPDVREPDEEDQGGNDGKGNDDKGNDDKVSDDEGNRGNGNDGDGGSRGNGNGNSGGRGNG